jgi:methyl-accepting chemotaxis protein
MKLSTKIFVGFGIVLCAAVILIGGSRFIMKGVAEHTGILSNQYMPETRIAGGVERAASRAVSAMNGYDAAYDDSFLSTTRDHLKQVKQNLLDAEQLTTRFPELKILKENAAIASARLHEFEKIVNDTEQIGKGIFDIRKKLDAAALEFMKTCLEFMDEHIDAMRLNIKQGADPITLVNQIENIREMNEVIQIVDVIRIDTLKGQLTRTPRIIEESTHKFEEMENALRAIQKKNTNGMVVSQIEDIRISASSYKTNMKKLAADYATLTDLIKKRNFIGNALSAAAEKTAVAGITETIQRSADVESTLNRSTFILIIGSIIGVVFCLVLIVIITRGISGPIGRIIAGLNEGADQVASATIEVACASQSLAEGTSEQAASIEETSASLEEMSSMTKQNAENARQANTLMHDAGQVISSANMSMTELRASMKEILRASEETSNIIKTIDDIAFQTNLLALNAAVEAARAGEAGAGFAVVADEVRNLSMRASEAARNTSVLIEETGKKVKDGSALVARTDEAFSKVADSTVRVGGLVSKIAAASSEQSQGIDQINKAVAEMDKVVQQNAAGAEESSSAAEELSAQAQEMKFTVDELMVIVQGKSVQSAGAGRNEDRSMHTSFGIPPRRLTPGKKNRLLIDKRKAGAEGDSKAEHIP